MPSMRLIVSRPVALLARVLQAALLLGLPSVSLAQATPAVSTVFSFSGSQTNSGPILGPDGALYGTAVTGAAPGLIFRTTTNGSSVQTLYQLKIENGYTTTGGLLGSGEFLYGTTALGDVRQTGTTGTVFRIKADGTEFTTLHRFATATSIVNSRALNADGAYPDSELIEGSDGFLYGVTNSGGPNGTGTVFKIARDGSTFTSLHSFGAIPADQTATVNENADGVAPAAALVEGADGYFYGSTSDGGANGLGTIFRLRFDGTGFQTLHVFSATTTSSTGVKTNADGAVPRGGLTDGEDGFYYGVASEGGESGNGTMFAISSDGTVFTVLHQFGGNDGARPVGALLLGNDGKLYGTTASGGTAGTGGTASTFGTIFVIGRDGTGFTQLHSFDNTKGSSPVGRLLQLTDSVFIGATTLGGNCGGGTVYRLSLTGETVTGRSDCGRGDNNNNGGGSMAPAILLLFGLLGFARRLRTR